MKMWKMETRKHSVTYQSINETAWYDCPTLARNDGVSLMLVGQGRENQMSFIYMDNERSFQFRASRAKNVEPGEKRELFDEWRVSLGGGLNTLLPEETPTIEEVRAIADNIADGLLAWGWYENTEQTTAKTVTFCGKTWRHWSPALGWGE